MTFGPRRYLLAVGAAAVWFVASAPPAAAHITSGGVGSTSYRSRIVAVSPRVAGLTVRLVSFGRDLELINHTGADVVVLGDGQEPYLRVGPGGVFENERSPTVAFNRSRSRRARVTSPTTAVEAPPAWRRLSWGPRARWHDHRTHWSGARPPPEVGSAPGSVRLVSTWTVDLVQLGRTVHVTGTIVWIPGERPLPWVLVGLGLGLGAAIGGLARRWWATLSVAVIALVVLDVVKVVGFALVPRAPVLHVLGRVALNAMLPVFGWAAGAWAVVALVRRRRAEDLLWVLAAGFLLAFYGGVSDVRGLLDSQVPFAWNPDIARLAVVADLGLGFGLTVGAGLALWRQGSLDLRGLDIVSPPDAGSRGEGAA